MLLDHVPGASGHGIEHERGDSPVLQIGCLADDSVLFGGHPYFETMTCRPAEGGFAHSHQLRSSGQCPDEVTRKGPEPLAKRAARDVIDTYRAWPVHRPGVDDVILASELEERHQLSFWDALVIVSAQRAGARTLLSEDLHDGRRIGELVIVNPCAPSAAV